MKKAFTLVELIIVLTVLLILISLIITGVRSSINKAYRLSCAKNMHTIIQALQLSVEDGIVFYDTAANTWKYSDAKMLYGLIYYAAGKGNIGGNTDLKTYICPATRHRPPTPTLTGYNNPLACDAANSNLGYFNPDYTGSSIDYWVIKKQKYFGNSSEFENPYFPTTPRTNAILWEASTEGSGVHHKDGRNLGFWNGSVKFISSFEPSAYPVNVFDNFLLPSDPNNGKPECDSEGKSIPITTADRHVYPYG